MEKGTDPSEDRKGQAARAWLLGLDHVWHAFFWSMDGLRAALRHEFAFRIEAVLVLILTPLALWLGQTAVQRVLLVGSLLLVLIVELLNSAVEATVDRISEEHHPLSKRAKDLGSAAVLVCLLNVVVTWLLVAWERFFT